MTQAIKPQSAALPGSHLSVDPVWRDAEAGAATASAGRGGFDQRWS